MAPFTSSLAEALAPGLLERFERYVRVDTQSARERERSPSTAGQLDLGRLLAAVAADPAGRPDGDDRSGRDGGRRPVEIPT